MGKGDSTEAAPNTTSNRSVLEEYNYKVGKVIGTGSYGTVYEAYHTKQKVMVAIKIISKKKASEDYLNKFMPRELQPLIPGPSLPGLTVSFLSLITNLSATGRDLKLENLLLDKQENVKISDFGFSKMVSSNKTGHSSPSYQRSSIFSQVSQTYCGSFAYSCPEILRGLPYNPFLSDTWSMGVILYTLMVAHLPFDDTNLKKLLRGTQKEVTFPPNHAISQECKSLILQMLCQAAKRATILDIIKDPWVLRFQAEPPTHEIKLLEVMFQPPNTTNAQPLE
ncbi:testis-specific serine/threonine-protein kinase 4 isoform X2 [Octodon degus]|uniref:non-specific serine/threonine protein kinase n=1 Tax=Octodon degus TaxID=10160 RepID=A0A6P6DTY4_OCTDE|nr:testis-specific serine/threonine-protein kinase 4 isoform X2 [Octodon degus]